MSLKTKTIVSGAILIALGILLAVLGIGQTIDIYFGIALILAGVGCLVLSGVAIARKGPLPVSMFLAGAMFLSVGIGLFTDYLSFAVLANVLVFGLLGLGAGLIALGIIHIAKKAPLLGAIEIAVGACLVVFPLLYLFVDGFQQAFWIIVGVLVAVYGVFVIVDALVTKKK